MEQNNMQASRFMRALRRLEHGFHRFGPPGGLPMGSFEVLMSVHIFGKRHEGPLRIGELSDHMERPVSAISRWVSELEQRGLLRRFSGDDRRTVCVELTDEGRALMEQGRRRLMTLIETMLSRMEAEDAEQLIVLMEHAGELLRVDGMDNDGNNCGENV